MRACAAGACRRGCVQMGADVNRLARIIVWLLGCKYAAVGEWMGRLILVWVVYRLQACCLICLLQHCLCLCCNNWQTHMCSVRQDLRSLSPKVHAARLFDHVMFANRLLYRSSLSPAHSDGSLFLNASEVSSGSSLELPRTTPHDQHSGQDLRRKQ